MTSSNRDSTTDVFRNMSRHSFQASYFTALNDGKKVICICLSQIIIAVVGLSKKGNCETYLDKYYDFQKTGKISRSKSIGRKMKKTGLKNSLERHCDEGLYYLSRSLQLQCFATFFGGAFLCSTCEKLLLNKRVTSDRKMGKYFYLFNRL